MTDERYRFPLFALLREQSGLSPAFPTGSYSYLRGIEWAVEAADRTLDSCRDGYRQIVLTPSLKYEGTSGLEENR